MRRRQSDHRLLTPDCGEGGPRNTPNIRKAGATWSVVRCSAFCRESFARSRPERIGQHGKFVSDRGPREASRLPEFRQNENLTPGRFSCTSASFARGGGACAGRTSGGAEGRAGTTFLDQPWNRPAVDLAAGWLIRVIGVIRGKFPNPFCRELHGLRGGGALHARSEGRKSGQDPIPSINRGIGQRWISPLVGLSA